MRLFISTTLFAFLILGCATTQNNQPAETPAADAPAVETTAVEAPATEAPQEVAPADGATPTVEEGAPQAEKKACDPCEKGKAGEAAWCDDCNKGYVDGKPVKCKGCYKEKISETKEDCAACEKS